MPALAAVRAHHSCVGGVCRPATCTVPVVRAPTTLQKKPSAWYSSDYVMQLDGDEGEDDSDADSVPAPALLPHPTLPTTLSDCLYGETHRFI